MRRAVVLLMIIGMIMFGVGGIYTCALYSKIAWTDESSIDLVSASQIALAGIQSVEMVRVMRVLRWSTLQLILILTVIVICLRMSPTRPLVWLGWGLMVILLPMGAFGVLTMPIGLITLMRGRTDVVSAGEMELVATGIGCLWLAAVLALARWRPKHTTVSDA
jgi:hypothetical protein